MTKKVGRYAYTLVSSTGIDEIDNWHWSITLNSNGPPLAHGVFYRMSEGIASELCDALTDAMQIAEVP